MGLKKGSQNKPHWLPDWEDISKYPDLKKATGRVWAWEFLRRNEKYQQLWSDFAALPPGPIYSGASVDAYTNICARFEREFGIWNPAPPKMTIADADFKGRPQFTSQGPRHWVMPSEPSDDDELDNFAELPEIYLDHPAEVVVKFDLRSQIKPQIIHVAKLLKDEAKHLSHAGVLSSEPRAWFGRYRDYLRILDAKLSGISNKTIGAKILGIKDPAYQKERAVSAFKAAKRLRDGDYRFLAALR